MANNDTTIVTCIEAGGLEEQVVLLARSLRQFGGGDATTPMVAVKARRGPPLQKSVLRALDGLGVRVVDKPVNAASAWWAHANKPAALAWASDALDTGWITWMDSDMLVLRELDGLIPDPRYDFIARAGEAFDVASSGQDEKAAFWNAVCRAHGLDFQAFPSITSFPDGQRIKAYWQAGLFSFKRTSNLAALYVEAMDTLLKGDVGSKFAGVYHTDQVALALAVQLSGLAVAEYDPTMNLNLNHKDPETFARYPIEDVKVVHYHGSFWPDTVRWAMDRLKGLDADQLALIEQSVPFSPGRIATRLLRRLYEARRARSLNAYVERARLI